MIKRLLEDILKDFLFKGKTIIIYGARQVGKTTLIEQLIPDTGKKTLMLNGDEAEVRSLLTDVSSSKLKPYIADNEIIVIDEAQRIPEAGLVLKIIHDNFKDVQLIATGSSAFDLSGKINEPMTGRKFEFFLHPISFEEMTKHHGFFEEKKLLNHRLIYGYYPDVIQNQGNEQMILKSLASSFLYKDLLQLEGLKKPVLLEKILKALALQTGNEVSFNELAQLLDSDKGTIEKYIDLLEKAYLIFRLNAFSKNSRNEIKKGKKIYFYDNGIRNTIIGNFLPMDARSDAGALWENFLISERQKFKIYHNLDVNSFFWRTVQQQEIDYIEEKDGHLNAFEFKLNPLKKAKIPRTFLNAYPDCDFKIITPANINDFLI